MTEYRKYIDGEFDGFIEGDFNIYDEIDEYTITELVRCTDGDNRIFLELTDEYIKRRIIVFMNDMFPTVADIEEALKIHGYKVVKINEEGI